MFFDSVMRVVCSLVNVILLTHPVRAPSTIVQTATLYHKLPSSCTLADMEP